MTTTSFRPQIKTALPGPRSQEILKTSESVEPKSIKRQFPLVWKKASGVSVEDVDGNLFLDFTSSVLIANIGHSHPRLQKVLIEQIQENIHSYNFLNPPRVELSKRLVEIAPPSLNRAFIATTGAEVIELALNAARQYTGKSEILSFFGGYHGKTYGAVSVGGKSSSREGLGSSMPGVIHAPFPYCYRCDFGKSHTNCESLCFQFIDRLLQCVGNNDLAAVIMEPFQGNAGQIQPPKEWVQKVAQWTKDKGAILIMDEVQASFGRTGKLFAFEHHDVVPNMVVAGKGISGGIPLTVLLGESRILDALKPDSLSSTHGGNPLAARAALETINIIFEEKLIENAATVGAHLVGELEKLQKKYPVIGEVRGVGLMIGVELVEDPVTKKPAKDLAKKVINHAIQMGLLLIQPIGFYGNVIRMSPPLVLTKEQADIGVEILDQAFQRALG